MLACSIAQLLIPTGELELFAGSERESAREVDGVVSTQRMRACAFGGFREKCVTDGVAVNSPPKALQVINCTAELDGGQASSLAHPGQGCGRLDMRDRGASDPVGVVVGALRGLGARLIDQQLDQGAGIEVETQRRPSET